MPLPTKLALGIAAGIALSSCSAEPPPAPRSDVDAQAPDAHYEVILASEVEWGQLNPARGAASPQAGTLWGDRAGSSATGFQFRPKDGFRSPPHIHNVTYRGVVISGVVHNDDPDAEEMWMPGGSFWTQPKGEIHITSAQGDETLAYIEIDRGPYLVLPVEEQFDSGERPINVHATNVVWVDWPNAAGSPAGVECSYLWGDFGSSEPHGLLLRLPAGFEGQVGSTEAPLRAVVIEGALDHEAPGLTANATLDPGSYFTSKGSVDHHLTCSSASPCVIYLRVQEELRIL